MTSFVVMMAAFNGMRFLESQLKSIVDQAPGDIRLLVSDDGSTDGTRVFLDGLADRWPKGPVAVIDGPRDGFAENYRHLILNSPEDGDLYAFSDQDDLWMPDKLSIAADWFGRIDNTVPGLFCSRTQIVDEQNRVIGLSPLFDTAPSFKNAIVQSIAGGNTMVLNRAARDLLVESCRRTGFVSHDWWSYLLVTGAGGKVCYWAEPQVRYRQHDGNLVGANASWKARMARLVLMAGGRFARWNEVNLKGLLACRDLLTDEARAIVTEFEALRRETMLVRMKRLARSGIHRQTTLGQLSLFAACAMNKL